VIEAGRVGRPHGLDGSFYVTRAVPDLIGAAETVEIDGVPREVLRRAGTPEAEALRGATLRVDEALSPLQEDEYWPHELAGCTVVDGDREVGVVRRMIMLPSCEALEVDRIGGGEVLVPMVHDAIRGIDRESRRIDVDMEFLGSP
jgi:16S rRNA processing protein RimM